tara:strand:- start:521 stop:1135 length:615 start_codon:yes stop_codon:yes gene_type:complete
MAKRLSRKRLFAINKLGETLTETAGAGISDSIGNSTRIRSGQEIISEITLDLANATAAASSFNAAGAGDGGAASVSVIGVSSSTGTHANAQILQIDMSASAATTNGVVTSGELICVETPAGGEDGIGLFYGTNASGSGAKLDSGGVSLIAVANQVVGKDGTFDVDVNIDNKYIYLVASGSTAAAYTAGKFVLRLYGFNIFDDVA